MPQPVPVSLCQITATFDPVEETLTFTGDINLPEHTIKVLPGVNMIVMNLKTRVVTGPESPANALVAEFPTFPVQWINADGKPIHAPECFQVQWHGAQRFTLVDFNSLWEGDTPLHYRFNVLVSYNGKTYGSDPTIINEPPGQSPD